MAGSGNRTNRNAYFAKRAKSEAKKLPNIAKIFIVFFFILGVAASFLVCHFLCKNDCFEINGKKSYSISVGETYVDDGVKVIGFGQDLTEKVTVKVYDANKNLLSGLDAIDTSEEAVYQIEYTVDSFRFKDVKLIRTVTVVPTESEDYEEEEDSYNPDPISFVFNFAY